MAYNMLVAPDKRFSFAANTEHERQSRSSILNPPSSILDRFHGFRPLFANA